jgi:hypothetical protein
MFYEEVWKSLKATRSSSRQGDIWSFLFLGDMNMTMTAFLDIESFTLV